MKTALGGWNLAVVQIITDRIYSGEREDLQVKSINYCNAFLLYIFLQMSFTFSFAIKPTMQVCFVKENPCCKEIWKV